MKTRNTFYAELGYLPRFSTTAKHNMRVPRGSAPGPRWGLCPQTPITSRFALVFFPLICNFLCIFVILTAGANCIMLYAKFGAR